MEKRTTITVDRAVVDFLHSQDVNVSRLCNEALVREAVNLGYLDIGDEIKRLTLRLNRLKRIERKKSDKDLLRWRFAAQFKQYLSGHTKTPANMKAWLVGPACNEFRGIVGHPKDLTMQKVNELVTLAMTTPELLEAE